MEPGTSPPSPLPPQLRKTKIITRFEKEIRVDGNEPTTMCLVRILLFEIKPRNPKKSLITQAARVYVRVCLHSWEFYFFLD